MSAPVARLALLLASALCILVHPSFCRPPSDEFGPGGAEGVPSNRVDTFELAKELQYLKERTAELALVADRVKGALASRQGGHADSRGLPATRGISKRHCWDVADVCCMWSIC